jgi:hypothetical protein
MTNPENNQKGTRQNTENSPETANQPSIKDHETFENMIISALKNGGIHINANKNFGKSFLLFSICEAIQKEENLRAIAFDGSEAWIYKASKIPVFTIGEHDITSENLSTVDEFERYSLNKKELVNLALETHKDILFRFKTKKPSKRAFLIRYVTQYLDSQQRQERDLSPTHEIRKTIALILDESQDAFSNRETLRLENEEFMCIFAEGRNSKLSFITSSQRLTELSKAIRSKQLLCLGKLAYEDITPFLRKLERKHNIEFAEMKPRTWLFENQLFTAPEFKQSGKPFQINSAITQAYQNSLPRKPRALTLTQKIARWLKPKVESVPQLKPVSNSFFESQNVEDSESGLDQQEKESENSDLEEIEEEWIK